MREYNHISETAADQSLWTKPDGFCGDSGYNDTSLKLASRGPEYLYLILTRLEIGIQTAEMAKTKIVLSLQRLIIIIRSKNIVYNALNSK